jgi:hypothetical protein
MTVLAHLAGVPVEELLVPLLASGATSLGLLVRSGWVWRPGHRGRGRASR